ncbi:ABC transporter ATP-binding protein [Sodalis ligni]|uniref:ABC transporter ATP-binding protein n=1 Tax=Sodalis ligni TaxID=2697027 RepID=UPI00193F0E57|nr:ABC transporter ATP-binding protein [Sodalis ligni]QWA12893.1 ABC transporter ATP-binding protein [Sodalis ligni]
MSLLTLDHIEVKLGGLSILRDISLRVDKGEIVCVLGANGVGKTTLMRTLSGIYHPAKGSIILDGEPIHRLPAHAIVRLGLAQAPEGRQIFPTMTVEENLILGGIQQGKHSREREQVLSLFPLLKERLKQKAGSLSGGEQQMLCIGRALMGRPRILLLDEPSLGLAPRLVQQIFELLQHIRRQGIAILLVEQNARAALKISHRAYVVEGGRISLSGAAADLAGDERIRRAYLGERRAETSRGDMLSPTAASSYRRSSVSSR